MSEVALIPPAHHPGRCCILQDPQISARRGRDACCSCEVLALVHEWGIHLQEEKCCARFLAHVVWNTQSARVLHGNATHNAIHSFQSPLCPFAIKQMFSRVEGTLLPMHIDARDNVSSDTPMLNCGYQRRPQWQRVRPLCIDASPCPDWWTVTRTAARCEICSVPRQRRTDITPTMWNLYTSCSWGLQEHMCGSLYRPGALWDGSELCCVVL